MCLFLNVGTIDNPEEKRNVDAARSLLIITLSPSSSENYTQFHDKVRYFNEQPPFNFYNPFSAYQKVVSNLISISKFRNKRFNSTMMLHIHVDIFKEWFKQGWTDRWMNSLTLTEYVDYPNVYYFVDNCICSIFIRRCDLVRQSCPSFTVGGRGDNQWDSHHPQSPEPKL